MGLLENDDRHLVRSRPGLRWSCVRIPRDRLAWLISHRNRGDRHKGVPYESGIDTFGDTWGRFGISFYVYALLFVAFDVEVVFLTCGRSSSAICS